MIKRVKITALFAFGILVLLSCKEAKVQDETKSFKINNQEWMTENLNLSTFRNGDVIPEVKTEDDWMKAGNEGKPAWCYYKNDPENGKKWGKLYNWYAVNDKRGLAPKGWHVASKAELEALGAFAGNNSTQLKATGQGVGTGAGTNTSGFSAMISCFRVYSGNFSDLGDPSYFWSSTEFNETDAYCMSIIDNNNMIYYDNMFKNFGFNVRCVKD